MHELREENNLSGELLDETQIPTDVCSEHLGLRIANEIFKIRPYIVDLVTYDIILRKSWLASVHPMSNWKAKRMRIKQGNHSKEFESLANKKYASILTCATTD